MTENDLNKNFREKLNQLESQAPGFEDLFRDEILGDGALRSVCQSKLAHYEEPAPSFEQLFGEEMLGKPVLQPKRFLSPAWAVFAAAACLGLLLLIPNRLKTNMETPSLTQQQEKTSVPSKESSPKHATIRPDRVATLLPQKKERIALATPLPVVTPVEDIVLQEFSDTSLVNERDPLDQAATKPISPRSKGNLAVAGNRSLDEAYAAAKALRIKGKKKKDAVSLGAGLNSANRLLSQVNTNPGNLPLYSFSNAYSNGYASLEGSDAAPTTTSLRSYTASANEWVNPENISPTVLQSYGVRYSLPVNLGAQVSIPLFSGVNLITGINYSFMRGVVNGHTNSGSFTLTQQLHYLGLPLKLSLNILKRQSFVFYAAGGGMLEKGLSGIQHCYVEGMDDWSHTQAIEGIQPSLSGQFGAAFQFGKAFSVYAEPGVTWYIPSDQPLSSRTEEPVNFNLSLGVRYLFK